MVSNCAYVGAVDIGYGSSSAVETTDFSDENQEDAELFSDSSEQTPEAEEEEAARPAAATEKVKVGIKGSLLTSHYFPTQTLKTLINTELFVILLVDK